MNRISEKTLEQIVELRAAGKTFGEISKLVKCPKSTVARNFDKWVLDQRVKATRSEINLTAKLRLEDLESMIADQCKKLILDQNKIDTMTKTEMDAMPEVYAPHVQASIRRANGLFILKAHERLANTPTNQGAPGGDREQMTMFLEVIDTMATIDGPPEERRRKALAIIERKKIPAAEGDTQNG